MSSQMEVLSFCDGEASINRMNMTQKQTYNEWQDNTEQIAMEVPCLNT